MHAGTEALDSESARVQQRNGSEPRSTGTGLTKKLRDKLVNHWNLLRHSDLACTASDLVNFLFGSFLYPDLHGISAAFLDFYSEGKIC